jgi:hypothetical protein
MAFVIFGVAIGALCAVLRYPVLMMLPMGGLLAIGAVLNGIIVHAHPGVIATEVFGCMAASQFAYASVSVTRHLVRSKEMMLQAQAAIGQELRAQLEVPRNLPSELSLLMAQLQLA